MENILQLIEDGIAAHGGDLGGWTKLDDDELKLFDGRVTLRAEFNSEGPADPRQTHVHIFATLHEYEDEVLDACVFGLSDGLESSVAQAAMIWITLVAGPIKSFIDGKPVCMTCQAGVQGGDVSEGYSPDDYGLSGLRAYVGPSLARGDVDEKIQTAIDGTKPWFRFAAESAAPRRVHLAKATISSFDDVGWERQLEIDGHEVSHKDPNWPAGVKAANACYMTRYAVFEFPLNSTEIKRRAELERTIKAFASNYAKFDDVDKLMEAMVKKGFNPDLVHEVESLSTIAFGRTLFENYGVQYSPTIIRAMRNGRVDKAVPLMSLPAYTRARALATEFEKNMSQEDFEALCFYNAESQAIMQALEAEGENLDLSEFSLMPCVVPDRLASEQTMQQALIELQRVIDEDDAKRKSKGPSEAGKKKPWWKFW